MNGALRRATGFAMKPVAGLVEDRIFLGYLSRSTFLATQYMRHPSRPTPYDPTGYQAALFVAPSFAGMAERVCAWLDELPDGPGA